VVTSRERFLIDASFIVEKTHKTFLGAPLLSAAGRNCTFTFGFLRDFLRLKRAFGINAGLVIFGREIHSVNSNQGVLSLISTFNELGIPHIHDPLNLTLNLARSICARFTHIITADANFLQFTGENLIVVLLRKGTNGEWDWMSPRIVKDKIGIAPQYIPTYMTLIDSSSMVERINRWCALLIHSVISIRSIVICR